MKHAMMSISARKKTTPLSCRLPEAYGEYIGIDNNFGNAKLLIEIQGNVKGPEYIPRHTRACKTETDNLTTNE